VFISDKTRVDRDQTLRLHIEEMEWKARSAKLAHHLNCYFQASDRPKSKGREEDKLDPSLLALQLSSYIPTMAVTSLTIPQNRNRGGGKSNDIN